MNSVDPKDFKTITLLRQGQTSAINELCTVIDAPGPSPQAKILAAHTIIHCATCAALLKKLRLEISNPGGKP